MTIFSKEVLAFLAVARTGSVRLAAEGLNVSPSALSRQIRMLEESLGYALFLRQSRGVELTEHGELMLKELGVLTAAEANAMDKLNQLNRRGIQRFGLGVMECMAAKTLVEILDQAFREHEDWVFYTSVGNTEKLVDQLLRQDVDVMVGFNTPRDVRLHFLREYRCPIGVVCSPDHPFARMDSVDITTVFGEGLVLADSSLTIYSRLEYELARRKRSARILMRTNSVDLLKRIVEKGGAITLLSRLDVIDEIQEGELVFVNISGARMFESLEIVTRQDDSRWQFMSDVVESLDGYLRCVTSS